MRKRCGYTYTRIKLHCTICGYIYTYPRETTTHHDTCLAFRLGNYTVMVYLTTVIIYSISYDAPCKHSHQLAMVHGSSYHLLFGMTGEVITSFLLNRAVQLPPSLLNTVFNEAGWFGLIFPVISYTSISSHCDTVQTPLSNGKKGQTV